MKRYGHPLNDNSKTLWEAICSMDNLQLAHKNARKGKTWYKEVKMVDENPDYYLEKLRLDLINKNYRTSEYETFIKKDSGKERLIYKLPYYPDRICQWAVVQVIEPILINKMTADTYSAIPERGVHKCLYKLRNDIHNDLQGTKYCLKLDIKKYYPSIDHDLLKSTYRQIFKDKDLLWLIDEIIDSTESGVPIGNYLSQYSGNIYLTKFDHWIKEVQGRKYYYRYMDDMVILAETKEELRELLESIRDELNRLKLNIKGNWQIFPINSRGIDFLGYRIFPEYTLLRKSTCKVFKRKMRIYAKVKETLGKLGIKQISSIASYGGWIKHCNGYRLSEKYIGRLAA